MTFDASINTADIELRFKHIAQMLFEDFAIQKGEKKYLFKEIEFYFYNKNHRDIITHPRSSKPLCWYINDFGGIDLNFGSSIANSREKDIKKYILDDDAYFGGILIRQLAEIDGEEVLKGPWACADLFRCYDATGTNMKEELPLLVEHDCKRAELTRGARKNLLRSSQTCERKVDNILYEYLVHPAKEILYQDFSYFKDKPYRYEKQHIDA